MNTMTHLECSLCGEQYDADELQTLCPNCQRPLLVRYDLEAVRNAWDRESLQTREPDMWRYREVLPVRDEKAAIRLGEGYTPLLPARRLGETLNMPHLFIKDESCNPTGSFKARGLCVAISRAVELGVKEVVIPSAGNAAGAMSAYAARAGMKAHVFMPKDVPYPFLQECQALGATVTLVGGLITDCGREAQEKAEQHGWFPVSTLKEPYRVEGKKTMGYVAADKAIVQRVRDPSCQLPETDT
jgi:threonine synthase